MEPNPVFLHLAGASKANALGGIGRFRRSFGLTAWIPSCDMGALALSCVIALPLFVIHLSFECDKAKVVPAPARRG